MRVVRASVVLVLLFLSLRSTAQTQLVLLNHEKVLARFKVGSVITYKKKKSHEYMSSLILEIREFAIVTAFDTIPFNKIERVSLKGFPHRGLTNLLGNFFMLGGIGYFAIDQVNSILVHGQGYDSDPQIWKPAVILVIGGFAMKQMYKRSQKIRYPAKLLLAEPGNPFYLADQ